MSSNDKQNLKAIIEAVEKIEQYIAPFNNADELFENQINFDATMMNFIVIGEMVEKLSHQFKEENSHIEWNKIKGFRNIIAHDYFGVDAEEVWQIIKTHLPKSKKKIMKILKKTK